MSGVNHNFKHRQWKTTKHQSIWNRSKKQALEQFRSGKSLTGKGGAFAPLFKQFLEAALDAELYNHLSDQDEQQQVSNRKNGKVSKTVKTSDRQVELVTSLDRNDYPIVGQDVFG